VRGGPLREVGAGEIEQRPQVPGAIAERAAGRHAGDGPQAAAAQPLQQYRLELVVGVMGGKQDVARRQLRGERRIAGVAGRGLGTGAAAGRDLDVHVDEGHAVLTGQAAAGAGPGGRIRMQPVIDVNRPQPRHWRARGGQPGTGGEQDRGIESAAQRDAQRACAARRDGRQFREQPPESLGQ
jgi:hypothetical protein